MFPNTTIPTRFSRSDSALTEKAHKKTTTQTSGEGLNIFEIGVATKCKSLVWSDKRWGPFWLKASRPTGSPFSLKQQQHYIFSNFHTAHSGIAGFPATASIKRSEGGFLPSTTRGFRSVRRVFLGGLVYKQNKQIFS